MEAAESVELEELAAKGVPNGGVKSRTEYLVYVTLFDWILKSLTWNKIVAESMSAVK